MGDFASFRARRPLRMSGEGGVLRREECDAILSPNLGGF